MVKHLEQLKEIKKQLESICVGDLICVDWCDASTGKSNGSQDIDVPVKSWGIFIGVLGLRTKHIVLAQNSFCYSKDQFDLDYTAIPLNSANDVAVVVTGLIPKEASGKLVNSFLEGHCHPLASPRMLQRRIFQQRLSLNGRPD